MLFSPIDPKTLFLAANVLFKTQDAGNSWTIISPDLSRETYSDIPESVGIYRTEEMKKMARRGVIYALAPSPKDLNTIWAGTDDGLIHITKDGGKNWKDITPVAPSGEKNNYWLWSKISMIEASHFDVNTAYIAVNRIRNDDMRPHIMRTRDGGKTWQEIVNGLPNDPINSVKEDPNRKGLLFAGSETAVYVSFDDGDHWQSLRLNMPATSIRDLVIKDDDLVIGTHGRSFWILDDITPLRQITADLAKSEAIFYKPQNPYKVRWNIYSDTPVPQEEAAGQNPPDGAIFDYFLKEKVSEVALEIFDASGKSIRKFSSNDKPYKIPEVNIPLYWIRPQVILSAEAGSQRFVWDMHYKPLDEPASYPISATFMNTAPDATSPWVLAGNYTAKMTINGKIYTQTFTIKQDPRVKTSPEKMKQIHDMSMICYEAKQRISAKLEVQKKEGISKESEAKLNKLKGSFSSIFNTLIDTDMPVTTQIIKALKESKKELSTL